VEAANFGGKNIRYHDYVPAVMEIANNFSLNKAHIPGLLTQLAKQWNLNVNIDCQRHTITVPAEYGSGQIIGYSVGTGLDAIIFDASFQRELSINFTGEFADPISFFTLATGKLAVIAQERRFSLKPLQGTIHGGFDNADYRLYFSDTEDRTLALITCVHKEAFFKEIDCETLDIPQKLLDVVKDIHNLSQGFLFQEIYHLPAVNALKDIIEQKQNGLLNSTFAAGKIHENMFLLLNEYKKFEINDQARFLRDTEKMELIRNAENILISHLQNPPTIPELAKMVGINQQSLKQGFRQLFGDTINQYLNEKRLEQAGILIQGGELSLGEIATTIGYSNPGYFSRRFKEKYGVTPRDFRGKDA
ncbi:MAG: AraC family transcriptional regulator, partial [Bacteroidota bacterium]